MFEGKIQQIGKSKFFYEKPASRRIASFFGNNNFLNGFKENRRITSRVGEFQVESDAADGPVTLIIRPESILLGDRGMNSFTAQVMRQFYMGTHNRYRIEVDAAQWEVIGPADSAADLEGRRVTFSLPPEKIWVMPEQRN